MLLPKSCSIAVYQKTSKFDNMHATYHFVEIVVVALLETMRANIKIHDDIVYGGHRKYLILFIILYSSGLYFVCTIWSELHHAPNCKSALKIQYSSTMIGLVKQVK